jgi:hypothetical protein
MHRAADFHCRFEGRHWIARSVTLSILKEPHTVGRFVRTRDEQIKIAVTIGIAWDRPRPKADTKVND